MKEKAKIILGIDVSKNTLDFYCLLTKEHFVLRNDPDSLGQLQNKMGQHQLSYSDLWLVFEHTGKYSHHLCKFCEKYSITYSQVAALEIKRSMGLHRGKNDKIDAQRIAIYAEEKRYKLVPSSPINTIIEELKGLVALRDKLVRQRAGYKTSVKELKQAIGLAESSAQITVPHEIIDVMTAKINQLEMEIQALILKTELKKNYQLLLTIKGIGPVIARYVLIYTANFTKFKDCRKFACYCGIVPFEHSSGMMRKRARISHLANKTMKSALDLGARSAIMYNEEIKQYYERKRNEGKEKRTIINAVRNKLVSRMFAIINKQQPYQIKIAA